MISSARVVAVPRRQRALSPMREKRVTAYAPRRVSRRHAITACMMGLLGLVVMLLTHAGTYSASLTRTSGQVDSLIGSSILQQGTQEGQHIPTGTATHTGGTIAKANTIERVNQLDPAQYNSQQDYTTWADSTCSTSSMTFVMNSYGHSYRIADVLKIEAGLHEITPDLGLLEPVGIDRTVARFGFQTSWFHNPTLTDILQAADSGTPVIVGFPPDTWSGGHLLVVRGSYGDNKGVHYVRLADSSKLNMQYMEDDTFLKYWRGFAVIVYPKGTSLPPTNALAASSGYSVLGKPTISADFINQVLASYNSPAQGKGQALYELGVQDGIDPAFALAFFFHESTLGTSGEATTTHSLGNLRCIPNTACINTAGQTCLPGDSCYAGFPTWEAGFQAWYILIKQGYIQGNINQVIGRNACPCTTISQIIPVYAPTSDNNDEQAYISSLQHSLDVWHSGQLRP
jgi:hypothetical protein